MVAQHEDVPVHPFPVPDDLSAPFWESTAQGVLSSTTGVVPRTQPVISLAP